MPREPLIVYPVAAPVQQDAFDLHQTLIASLAAADVTLREGDVIAISSKYAAISEGQVVALDSIVVTPEAAALAERYAMNPRMAQLVMNEADHIYGGIQGFMLTYKDGIISANAGIDRSNIPNGYAVVFPRDPFASAARIVRDLQAHYGLRVGVILTDSWLMPGRWGTTGVALATAGFYPMQDERGKFDLFGNPMLVTVRGIADQICAAAQLVMGERDEATPFAVVRNAGVVLTDKALTVDDVSIDRRRDIYVESLTDGLLERVVVGVDSAP